MIMKTKKEIEIKKQQEKKTDKQKYKKPKIQEPINASCKCKSDCGAWYNES